MMPAPNHSQKSIFRFLSGPSPRQRVTQRQQSFRQGTTAAGNAQSNALLVVLVVVGS